MCQIAKFLILTVVFILGVSSGVSCEHNFVEVNKCRKDTFDEFSSQGSDEMKVRVENYFAIPGWMTTNGKTLAIRWRISEQSFTCSSSSNDSLKMPTTTDDTRISNNLSITYDDTVYNTDHKNRTAFPLFSPGGYVFWKGESYHPDEYCIAASNESSSLLTLCHPNCGNSKSQTLCLQKCCPPGQSIDMVNHSCATSGENAWAPRIYQNPDDPVSDTNPRIHFKHQLPKPSDCTAISSKAFLISRHNRDLPGVSRKSPFRILSTGSVVTLNERTKSWNALPSWTPFCVDGMQNFQEQEQEQNFTYYSGQEEQDDILILCEMGYKVEEKSDHDRLFEIGYAVLLFISAGFAFLTSIVQLVILEKKTAHSWTILCSMLSMFFTYFFLGTSHTLPLVFPVASTYLKTTPCVLVGIITHYSLLSIFFWMTVFDYDIWKTFRSIDGLSHKLVSKKKLYVYTIFGYGVPGVIVLCGYSLDLTYQDRIISPNYGQDTCYISHEALGLWVYAIIGILMIFNLIFISSTAISIHSIRFGSRNLQRNSKRQSSWELFGKLFLIMGTTWTLELISWIHSELFSSNSSKRWYWHVTDLVNILQPLAIFIIVVCKRKTLLKLQFKFNLVKSIVPSLRSFSRTSTLFSPHSSSKHRTTSMTSRKGSNVTSILILNDLKINGRLNRCGSSGPAVL